VTKVRHEAKTQVPRERVFAYVDDYRSVPDWMFGVSRFEPVTEKTSGVGSVFDASMKLGPKTLHTTLKCTEWVREEKIVLESVDGLDVSCIWSFAGSAEETRVVVEVDYRLPGGLAGRALGAIVEPAIAGAIKHTESELIKGLTAAGAA
jgi:uncharacterized membrane protein